MELIKLGYDEALALLKRAVAEQGEDHRAADHYFENGQPHCIVGHVLSYKGLDVCTPEYDGEFPFEGRSIGELPVFEWEDQRTRLLLVKAQDYQDCGRYWGDAVREAEETVGVLL